ncbi:MAG: AAA domain-containing protein [Nitrospiraceae bacterium]|nr:AAA domain-containing protein [Nitrospiraceae bacterium]
MQVHVSPEVNSLLNAAVQISVRRSNLFVGVEHLFAAILEAPELLPKAFTDRYLPEFQRIAQLMGREAWRGGPPSGASDVFYTPRCAVTLHEAAKLAERYRSGAAGAGHLLMALLADAHAAPSRALDQQGLHRGDILTALRAELTHGPARPSSMAAEPVAAALDALPGAPAPQGTDAAEGAPAFNLDTITRDLTASAREGRLEKTVGRKNEIFEILQILTRKNKNNAILVGEAGVGKTQIVEGLALASVRNGLGGVLGGFRILELSLGALMTGTQYRGAFEEKILAMLEELKRSKNVILFIDEIHLIMGAGATDGDSMDAANLLKPALARGEIRVIGATTLQEYRTFVEKDPAIERRFQMVRVEPLSESATLRVLDRLRPSLQDHHGVRISTKALEASIRLTQRYMPNRHLPDKAIDVLDQACARYRLKAIVARQRAAATPGAKDPARANKVTPHDIRKVVSQLTSVPIEEMTAQERLFLSNLEDQIKRRIIGQDTAVAKAVSAVKKSRAGLADPNRPQAVLLFLGPSGVGKTQLAKVLADLLFGASQHFTTFDMTEYGQEHSVSRLLGAPPGYVGHEEEGLLTAAMRTAPFSVLLFDEIEKAHPKVFDIFLPVFDEGRLKDARGRTVSFRNAIMIMTSNVGADLLHRTETGDNRRQLLDELRKHFRPEFINRIDEIVPFYPLLFEDMRTILGLAIDDLRRRLSDKQVDLHVYQRAYEFLAREGHSPEFGARELRRTVDRLVVGPISDMVLQDQFRAGDAIEVLMEDDRLTIRKATQTPVGAP